jgi:hypothetical protein
LVSFNSFFRESFCALREGVKNKKKPVQRIREMYFIFV